MEVKGVENLGRADSVAPAEHERQVERVAGVSPPRDDVQLSDAAKILARLEEVPEVRQDRVAEVRAAIERGDYVTDDKIRLAVERLLEEMEPA